MVNFCLCNLDAQRPELWCSLYDNIAHVLIWIQLLFCDQQVNACCSVQVSLRQHTHQLKRHPLQKRHQRLTASSQLMSALSTSPLSTLQMSTQMRQLLCCKSLPLVSAHIAIHAIPCICLHPINVMQRADRVCASNA